MHTLLDTIRDIKDNKKPDYEDLRYAVLALLKLNAVTQSILEDVSSDTPVGSLASKKRKIKLLFSQALITSPKEFVGWKDDPENPEYQRYRQVSKRILNRFRQKLK
jgi:hypothetical protein